MNEFGGRGGVLARCDARFLLSAGVGVGSKEGGEGDEDGLESGERTGMKETYSGISTVIRFGLVSILPVDKLEWDVLSCGDCSLNVL